jgi:uncharacterized protein (DUF362 family)
MIFEAADFAFVPPKEVAFARRVLIKPSAGYAKPHPATTSRETMAAVVEGIRKVSAADILLLEKSSSPDPIHSIYKMLGYDLPRTILLDADQCIPVAVENPLPKPFALSTFWMPNVILSCDFLISIAPFKVVADKGDFSIKNALGLLPSDKYRRDLRTLVGHGANVSIDSIVADLYFTLPFDLGIVDARKKLVSPGDPTEGQVEDFGKVFVGSPFEVDSEASECAGVRTEYLELIERAKREKENAL